MTGIQRQRTQHKQLGLIGGMSWRSTMLYYERLNRAMEQACGPHHSFTGRIVNLDYAGLLGRVAHEDWNGICDILSRAAQDLSRSGCDVVALTAVTAHLWFDDVRKASGATVPHVLTATAHELDMQKVRSAGVLGTQTTCSSSFVRNYLGAEGRRIIVLDAEAQSAIDHLIQSILTADDDRTAGSGLLLRAIETLASRGADAVVLACTELPLLLPLHGSPVPLLDSVALHVNDICDHILTEAS